MTWPDSHRDTRAGMSFGCPGWVDPSLCLSHTPKSSCQGNEKTIHIGTAKTLKPLHSFCTGCFFFPSNSWRAGIRAPKIRSLHSAFHTLPVSSWGASEPQPWNSAPWAEPFLQSACSLSPPAPSCLGSVCRGLEGAYLQVTPTTQGHAFVNACCLPGLLGPAQEPENELWRRAAAPAHSPNK